MKSFFPPLVLPRYPASRHKTAESLLVEHFFREGRFFEHPFLTLEITFLPYVKATNVWQKFFGRATENSPIRNFEKALLPSAKGLWFFEKWCHFKNFKLHNSCGIHFRKISCLIFWFHWQNLHLYLTYWVSHLLDTTLNLIFSL